MDGWMGGWMDGWMDGQTDGRMDRQTDVFLSIKKQTEKERDTHLEPLIFFVGIKSSSLNH